MDSKEVQKARSPGSGFKDETTNAMNRRKVLRSSARPSGRSGCAPIPTTSARHWQRLPANSRT